MRFVYFWYMYSSQNSSVQTLLDRLQAVHRWHRLGFLLGWDQETQMPPVASDVRATDVSFVDGQKHEAFLALNEGGLLEKLIADVDGLSDNDAIIVKEIWKDYQKKQKLPLDFVQTLSGTSSKAMMAWQTARAENNPDLFLPLLQEMIDLKRQAAEYYGYESSAYNALLDEYEPGMAVEVLDTVLAEVRDFTVDLLAQLRSAGAFTHAETSHKAIPAPLQKILNDKVAALMGFDFGRGATAISTHPFTADAFSGDVRFTSRYNETDMLYAMGSTLHETGHGLYEQGLPVEFMGTPLAESISLGIHESQSRFYENYIGRSTNFAEYLSKKMQSDFDIDLSSDDIFAHINAIHPSLIRVEADELTYNLHIIIRYEIEKMMFEEGLQAHQIEEAWNEKYKEYLGVEVDCPANGFLQDVHWSFGLFGYFPTYTLGNLYSAQFANTLNTEVNIEEAITKQNYSDILHWMRKNIHKHGRRYSAAELVKNVTGEELNAKYLKARLRSKVENILNKK